MSKYGLCDTCGEVVKLLPHIVGPDQESGIPLTEENSYTEYLCDSHPAKPGFASMGSIRASTGERSLVCRGGLHRPSNNEVWDETPKN